MGELENGQEEDLILKAHKNITLGTEADLEEENLPEPKWKARTDVLREQINEGMELAGKVHEICTFIKRPGEPTDGTTDDPGDTDEKPQETRSPLNRVLDDLQAQMSGLTGRLTDLVNQIDY